jgi:hypothetical protein
LIIAASVTCGFVAAAGKGPIAGVFAILLVAASLDSIVE